MTIIKHLFLLTLVLCLSACQWSKLANRDTRVELLLIQINEEISVHWQKVLALPLEQRKFAKYQESYIRINSNLNVLLRLNKYRSDNEESITQIEYVLTMWRQDLAKHQKEDKVTDFTAKRREEQYQRTINAIIKAEQAKPIASY